MTRGRKKDLTIPPTRALVQQRDYRARRAQYVADLEDRLRRAEEENELLRGELAAARAGHIAPPLAFDSQTAHASSELMQSLSMASASLARFHRLAFPEQHHNSQATRESREPPHPPLSHHPLDISNTLRPASFPSPAPSPPYIHNSSNASTSHTYYPTRRKRLYREDSPESVTSPTEDTIRFRPECRSESPESECCGGIMDCEDLIQRDDGEEESRLPRPSQLPEYTDTNRTCSATSRRDSQRY